MVGWCLGCLFGRVVCVRGVVVSCVSFDGVVGVELVGVVVGGWGLGGGWGGLFGVVGGWVGLVVGGGGLGGVVGVWGGGR